MHATGTGKVGGAVAAIIGAAGSLCVPAAADEATSLRGKQVTLIVGTTAGGGYDAFTRLIAAHLGRHLPGQRGVVVQNMPGAGSVVLANQDFYTTPPAMVARVKEIIGDKE